MEDHRLLLTKQKEKEKGNEKDPKRTQTKLHGMDHNPREANPTRAPGILPEHQDHKELHPMEVKEMGHTTENHHQTHQEHQPDLLTPQDHNRSLPPGKNQQECSLVLLLQEKQNKVYAHTTCKANAERR